MKANKKLTISDTLILKTCETEKKKAEKGKISLSDKSKATGIYLDNKLRECRKLLFEGRGLLAGVKMVKLLTGSEYTGWEKDPKEEGVMIYTEDDPVLGMPLTLKMKTKVVKEYFSK